MKTIAVKRIAVFAALVLGSAANAATYDYTAHYDYVRQPSLPDADAQLQADRVSCDSAVGVQRTTPSASYRSCMLQHGWKYSFMTR